MRNSCLGTPCLDKVREAWQKHLKTSGHLSCRNCRAGEFVVEQAFLNSKQCKGSICLNHGCQRCIHQWMLVFTIFCSKLSGRSIFSVFFLLKCSENLLNATPSQLFWVFNLKVTLYQTSHSKCITYTSLLARRLILLNWKDASPRHSNTGSDILWGFWI